MLKDLQKSVNSILHERVSSPLFGTFILTWLGWNWKIVLYIFTVSKTVSAEDRMDYILSRLNDTSHSIWYPILSTMMLLTVVPFISLGALWLKLWFDWQRNRLKNAMEGKQLLSI